MRNITVHSKQEIAMQHLNLALSERIKGRNPYSVLHLAGAAEEMLGKLVELKSKKHSLDRVIDWMQSWWEITGKNVARKADRDMILKAKNGIKHINNKIDTDLMADIEHEINETIRRALENFIQLQLPVTEEIMNYYKFQKK